MEEPEENKNGLNQLSEMEILVLEQQLLEMAFENSFMLITGKSTFEDLVVNKHKTGGSAILAHDPHLALNIHEVKNIIEHFVGLEEYEKCQELKNVIDADCE